MPISRFKKIDEPNSLDREESSEVKVERLQIVGIE